MKKRYKFRDLDIGQFFYHHSIGAFCIKIGPCSYYNIDKCYVTRLRKDDINSPIAGDNMSLCDYEVW